MAADWLKDAIFYEIYPQSFYDTNGDGIGDIPGITAKLDYIRSLGCNALWINPWYDSPFKDAGYDVRDYKAIAPRYGTLEDARELFRAAHEKGIHVLLDLVAGHTSEEHRWFLESGREERNEFSDRYIWTDSAFTPADGLRFVGGEMPRDATYVINFFMCQPALNYGFRQITQPWQQNVNDPGPLATREAMKDVMRFWLDLGCDGFRVDMADSLVKKDTPNKDSTQEVWRDLNGMVHSEYPQAAMVSEWNQPTMSLNCGFDMDFYLDWFGNGYSQLLRHYRMDKRSNILFDDSYFKADSRQDASAFLLDYLPKYLASRDKGLWCFITGNHDTKRLTYNLTDRERRLAFAFLLTMPGAPYIYYGDEIGLRYQILPTKEGGYHRTGSRTPMQWSAGPNLGFSEGKPEELYLPVDPAEDAPTVAAQEGDPDSMLNHVRALTALRHSREELQNYSPFTVYSAGEGSRLFAYKRGALLLAVNPAPKDAQLKLDGAYRAIYTLGDAGVDADTLKLGAQSFVVLEPLE